MLRMAGGVDFTDRRDVPLTMDVDISKMVTFKAGLLIAGVSTRKRGTDEYAMNGFQSADFMTEFYALDG